VRVFFEELFDAAATPCWCYGSETMDRAAPLPSKTVEGFNGTERPGAVYLAAVCQDFPRVVGAVRPAAPAIRARWRGW
jgi:hypothetical protein